MLTAAAYDIHVERLLDRMRRFHEVLDAEGIPYRIIGGMATFIHVSERDPERARRAELPRVIAAGIDMLTGASQPSGDRRPA